MINSILYWLLRGWVFLARFIPFRLLYLMSDLCYGVLYHVVRYRRGVVRRNLTRSFPHKTVDEIVAIEQTFYRYLCDWAHEVFKLGSFSPEEIRRRMVFKNIEQLNSLIDSGRSGFALVGHCANWEFINSMTLWLSLPPGICIGHVYRPQHNLAIDRFFCWLRGRFGSKNISEFEILRETLSMKRDGRQFFIGVLADQIPNINGSHQWVDFLRQDTPIYNGIQKIAVKTGAYLGYYDVRRVARGYYETEFRLLCEDCTGYSETELALLYIKEVERTIDAYPPYWLWTHNRWKRTRAHYEEMRYQ